MTLRSPRILVVEDDEVDALVIQRACKTRGWKVNVVCEPTSVEAAIGSFDPDMVLLDISMPGGEDLHSSKSTIASMIREKNLSVMILSGHHASYLEQVAEELGAAGYMEKASPTKLIVARVSELLADRDDLRLAA